MPNVPLDGRQDRVAIIPKSIDDAGKPINRVGADSFKRSDGATGLEMIQDELLLRDVFDVEVLHGSLIQSSGMVRSAN